MSAESVAIAEVVKCGAMIVGGAGVTLLCAYGLYKIYEKYCKEKPYHYLDEFERTYFLETADNLLIEVPGREEDPNEIKDIEKLIRSIEKKRSACRIDIERGV